MRRTALFAGGPLHGQTMKVDGMHVQAVDPPDVSVADLLAPDSSVMLRQVTYTVAKLYVLGRVVWIGHLGTRPDESLVFEVLTSGAAKAASEVPDPAFR